MIRNYKYIYRLFLMEEILVTQERFKIDSYLNLVVLKDSIENLVQVLMYVLKTFHIYEFF